MLSRLNRACVALGVASLLALPGRLGAQALMSGPVVNPLNGHTYYLLTSASWSASQAFAQSLGGNLATVRSAAENQWISDTFTSNGTVNRALWIGFTDAAQEGTWVWASGEAVTYTGWDLGQPNNGRGAWEEDYAHLWGTTGYGGTRDKWNDYLDGSSLDGQAPLHGVVELTSTVPEPSTGGLAALGFVLALWRRRRTGRATRA